MSQEQAKSSLLRGTSIVAFLTLISRGLGFVEQLFIATFFGAGGLTDAFFIAFRIPNLLRSFVAEGALTSAFVPVFTTELNDGLTSAQKLLRTVTSLVSIITIILSILGIIFAPEVVNFIAPGFGLNNSRGELCVLLTRIMFPYIMFVSIVAMLNGALNSVNRYGAAPLAQITMNIVLIIGIIFAGQFLPETGLVVVACFVILGGIAQIIVQFPALKATHLSIKPALHFITPQTKQILKLMAPAILGAAVYQIGVMINSMLASLLSTGSVSWLFYADRLAQLPIGVFTVALASVLLPTLSRSAAKKDSVAFETALNDSLRYTSFCMIPFAFLMYIFALPVTKILFERGVFTNFDTQMTALAVQATAFGLWGISCSSMVIRGFIAHKDTKTPVLIGIITLLINVLISILIMGTPTEDTTSFIARTIIYFQNIFGVHLSFAHVGLAIATGLASTITLLLALILLDRRCKGLTWKPFLLAVYKTLAISIGMYFCVTTCAKLLDSNFNIYISLILQSCVAVISFIIFGKILKIKELEETFSTIQRKLNRTNRR